MSNRQPLAFWMQTALAIADHGTPGRAAIRLGLAVTTVYRHIDALEGALGFPLFHRARTGWRPRETATALIAAGAEIDRLMARAEETIREAAGAGPATLRIAVSEDFAAHYVAPRLKAFCAESGAPLPDLIIGNAFANLAQGEADVAIRPHMAPGDTLVGRRAGRFAHAFYASAGYIRAHGAPARPNDLARHVLCGYGDALSDFTAAQWIAAHVPPETIIARFGGTGAMVQAVASGLGLGLLPRFVGDAMNGLKPVLAISGGLDVDIWLVSAAANRKHPHVRAFFKFFASEIKKDAALFSGRP